MSTDNLYPVPVYTQRRGFVRVEDGATLGARAGVNLYDENGDLIPPENLNTPALIEAAIAEHSQSDHAPAPTIANAATTLSATHLNGVIEKSDTSAYTYTIAPSLGAHGDSITIVNSGTAGNITLARGAGVALYQNGVDADITIGPGSMLKIYRSATADRWIAR